MNHAFRSYSLFTITYSLNRNGQAARSTRATARRRRYISAKHRWISGDLQVFAARSASAPYQREADVAMASRHCATRSIITPASRRGCGSCCFRGLRAAKAFRVPRRRAFVSRGLPGTEGWNGAAAFDEGRGTGGPNGGQWTASSAFRSKRRRAIPAAEPPGRPRGSWSRVAQCIYRYPLPHPQTISLVCERTIWYIVSRAVGSAKEARFNRYASESTD